MFLITFWYLLESHLSFFGLKTPLDAPKAPPRHPQDARKTPQDASKTAPGRFQDAHFIIICCLYATIAHHFRIPFPARHFRMLLSHTVVCNTLSDATFALFTHASFVCKIRTFSSYDIFANICRTLFYILQHVVVPCLFARHFRIAFSHATFARSVLPLLSVRSFPG